MTATFRAAVLKRTKQVGGSTGETFDLLHLPQFDCCAAFVQFEVYCKIIFYVLLPPILRSINLQMSCCKPEWEVLPCRKVQGPVWQWCGVGNLERPLVLPQTHHHEGAAASFPGRHGQWSRGVLKKSFILTWCRINDAKKGPRLTLMFKFFIF